MEQVWIQEGPGEGGLASLLSKNCFLFLFTQVRLDLSPDRHLGRAARPLSPLHLYALWGRPQSRSRTLSSPDASSRFPASPAFCCQDLPCATWVTFSQCKVSSNLLVLS